MITREQLRVLSGIIEELYTNPDFVETRGSVLKMLQVLVPSYSITFFIAEEGGSKRCVSPMCIGAFESEPLDEYVEIHQDNDHSKWLFTNGKSNVYRETDYFSEEALNASEYYKTIYVANDIKDSLQMAIAKNNAFMGIITFFRRHEDRDFSDEEVMVLEALIPHFENRLFYEIVQNPSNGDLSQGDSEISFTFATARAQKIEDNQNLLINTLTKREKEIFGLLTEGKSIEELKNICLSLIHI